MTYKEVEEKFSSLLTKLFKLPEYGGSDDYSAITDEIIELMQGLEEFCKSPDTEDEPWYLGEGGDATLDDFITGAYWHYTEWHAGQYSQSYAALCALGGIFSPGMSTVELDNATYQRLNEIAEPLKQKEVAACV